MRARSKCGCHTCESSRKSCVFEVTSRGNSQAKPGFRIQYAGHPPVTCLSATDNAMQVPATGPSGIEVPGSGLFSCTASRAMCDKYLLTATAVGHRLRDLILALGGGLIKN
ncbi:LOW QUALITY PROTEIN: uncharacterized protein LOC26535536 [Drosophila yakuba]|uniref:Uncharacterized protein n=1 Tax=Drosophila yakuba TaxID=7245 RepID=A0A0R1DVQ4_DROYA|nr:LOW QUALITY PROTEIN: uncharacterized protein LOC26535536 [Drosophila yakuba]KRK01216.1 LOW QUALITY PROTEIN: uncharacterized protein Dyak_GE28355 [Drosophila yakuba]